MDPTLVILRPTTDATITEPTTGKRKRRQSRRTTVTVEQLIGEDRPPSWVGIPPPMYVDQIKPTRFAKAVTWLDKAILKAYATRMRKNIVSSHFKKKPIEQDRYPARRAIIRELDDILRRFYDVRNKLQNRMVRSKSEMKKMTPEQAFAWSTFWLELELFIVKFSYWCYMACGSIADAFHAGFHLDLTYMSDSINKFSEEMRPVLVSYVRTYSK